jgi:hypothetical protein
MAWDASRASVCPGILKPPLSTAIDAGQSKLHLFAGRSGISGRMETLSRTLPNAMVSENLF